MQPEAKPSAGTTDAAGRELILRASLTALGLSLVDHQVARLLAYLDLLRKWNKIYNLTAIRDPDEMLQQHLVDTLTVIPVLAGRIRLETALIADVGSGAGLPGIPLAIAFPHAQVLLIEPVGKKSAFQRQCQAELALTNVRVLNDRSESVQARQDLVICRAFASLPDFVAATEGMTDAMTLRVAMKGRLPEDELAALGRARLSVETLRLTVPGLDAERHLVLMRQAS